MMEYLVVKGKMTIFALENETLAAYEIPYWHTEF